MLIIRRVLRFLQKCGISAAPIIISNIAFCSGIALFHTVQSFCLGYGIDMISPSRNQAGGLVLWFWEIPSPYHQIFYVISLYFLTLFLGLLLRAGQNSWSIAQLEKLTNRLRVKVYEQLINTAEEAMTSEQVGRVLTAFSKDVNKTVEFLGVIVQMIMSLSIAVFTAAFLLMINKFLFLMAIVSGFFGLWCFHSFGRRIERVSGKVHQHSTAFLGDVERIINNAKSIRLYGQEGPEKDRFQQACRKKARFMTASYHAGTMGSLLQASFQQGGVLLVFLLCSFLASIHQLTVGNFVAVFFQFQAFLYQIVSLGSNLLISSDTTASLENLEHYFLQDKGVSHPLQGNNPYSQGDIQFGAVCVSDKKTGHMILENITLHIPKGIVSGVVGPVGSGKTTLLRMLPRLVVPVSGTIKIQGVPLEDIALDDLRSHIGYVDQISSVFSGTVKDNICFGTEVTEQELSEVLQTVHLEQDVASWPKGLDTVVGEGGLSLSSGQRQRITLARAILSRPSLLILDDAFSHLDRVTEQKIIFRLRKFCPDSTIIFSSNNLAPLIFADMIVVLLQGRVVEIGQHAELLRQNGLYAELFSQQLEQEKDFRRETELWESRA